MVKKVENFDDVITILSDDEISYRIGSRGMDFSLLPSENSVYIGGYLDGEIIALMVYYIRDKYTTCHVHVLKAHRARLAVKFGRESLKLRPCDVLYTNIPPKFSDVIKFAEHFGFKYIGKINGESLYGVNYGVY